MARRCAHCGRRFGAEPSYCPDDGHALRPDPLLEHVFEGRRIVRFLGEGAMGAVFRARDPARDADEALKILLARDPEAVRRFQQEVRIVSELQDPHTVHLHAHGRTSDDYLFIVMALVPGRTVEEVLAREDRLSPLRAARVVYQVCSSMAEAHARHIVHRDLKPGNVILETRETGEFARVLDFGVARLRGEGGIRTEQGRVFGTPAYSSPEQAIGAPDLDARSDVYGLGILLYEMLTGHNPFLAEDTYSTLRRQLELHPPPPTEGPPGLIDLTMDMLAKRREQRVPDVDAVRARLEAIPGVLRADTSRAEADLSAARARLDANLRDAERLAREVRASQARTEMDRARLDAEIARHRRRLEGLRATLATSITRLQEDLADALEGIEDQG